MKLSEFLVNHPELDKDVEDNLAGVMVLDAAYLFRVISPDHPAGGGRLQIHTSDHTDGLVYRGMITGAIQLSALDWMHGPDCDCDHE